MNISELKNLKITKLKKELKSIVTWKSYNGCSLETILNSIEEYSNIRSPKHNLFIQNLKK
tara:strand:- start:67 stop:246 length:180 start_codon:yes stop_codon:yes gene_type:complete